MENYSDIYERMKKKYEQVSSSEFDEASDIAIRMKVLAGEIYNAQVNADWLKRQMFVTTASGEYLDYFASQRGLERKQRTAEISHYRDRSNKSRKYSCQRICRGRKAG